MSNGTREVERECDVAQGCGAVELMIEPRARDLGGLSVRRVLPTMQRRMVGPWIFFDHMGPAQLPAGQGIDVRPHPHINLATVTYLFEGEILHRDSLGSLQPIRPGDVNLMVAGRGITHSERERPEVRATPHAMHGLQLWMALPDADEEVEPAFHHYPKDRIPVCSVEGVEVRVVMGSAFGVSSPVRLFGETLYVEAELQRSQSLALPAAPERAAYLASGRVRAGDQEIPAHAMAVFAPGESVTLEATEPTRLVIIGDAPVGPRHIEWNVVSSRKARIEQAKRDWEARRFPPVPGDEDEFIPLPS